MSNKLDQLDGLYNSAYYSLHSKKSVKYNYSKRLENSKAKKLYKYNGYRVICKKNNNILPKLDVNIADKNLFKKYIEKYDRLEKNFKKIKGTKFSNNLIIVGGVAFRNLVM